MSFKQRETTPLLGLSLFYVNLITPETCFIVTMTTCDLGNLYAYSTRSFI